LLRIAPGGQVIEGAGKFQAKRTSHAVGDRPGLVQSQELTPSCALSQLKIRASRAWPSSSDRIGDLVREIDANPMTCFFG